MTSRLLSTPSGKLTLANRPMPHQQAVVKPKLSNAHANEHIQNRLGVYVLDDRERPLFSIRYGEARGIVIHDFTRADEGKMCRGWRSILRICNSTSSSSLGHYLCKRGWSTVVQSAVRRLPHQHTDARSHMGFSVTLSHPCG